MPPLPMRGLRCVKRQSQNLLPVAWKTGRGYTSYVQGGVSKLELGDSIYKDTDELATYREK